MKKTSFIFLLSALFFQHSYTQNIYTKCIEKSSVSWALDATDTLRFSTLNLSLLLRQQLNNEKIKVAITEPGTISVPGIRFVKKNDIIKMIAPNRATQTMDADGNSTGKMIKAEEPLLSSKYFDEQTADLLEVAQVLYIKSGKLQSYNSWVSPKYAVTTSWGERLGTANAFSTSFQKCRSFSKRLRKQSASLGTHRISLNLDSSSNLKMLKQLYGQNLAQALWPHLGKKFYQMQLPGSNIRLTVSKLNQTLIEENPLPIPVYDEDGKVTGQRVILQESQPLDLTKISRIDVQQDWFYHTGKNKVYSIVKELLFYAVRSKSGVPQNAASPVLRIFVK